MYACTNMVKEFEYEIWQHDTLHEKLLTQEQWFSICLGGNGFLKVWWKLRIPSPEKCLYACTSKRAAKFQEDYRLWVKNPRNRDPFLNFFPHFSVWYLGEKNAV